MKIDFEEYLAQQFDGLFHGSKDEVENAFDAWLSNLDGQEYIDYANKYAEIMFLRGEITGITNSTKAI